MKKYGYLLMGLASLELLASSSYETDNKTKNSISSNNSSIALGDTVHEKKQTHKKIKKDAPRHDTSVVLSSNELKKKTSAKKDDEFKLGKIVALSEDGLKKKHGFTRLDKIPSWDFGYGAPAWLTKPGAKVIVPRSNNQYTYGIVLKFERPLITILVDQKADGSYETKEFRADKLGSLKWIHKSWITKKRGAILMDKEKAFVNYNPMTKNFDKLVL